MGAGTSATEMVFFITSIIIALSVVGAIFMNVESISGAATIGSKTLIEQLKTDITVINDPGYTRHSSGNYTFYIKNTGAQELGTEYINVIIDGTFIPNDKLDKKILVSETWLTGDVLQINATIDKLPGDNHNLRVITANGIEDTFSFGN
jgi:flagellar protein FlaG